MSRHKHNLGHLNPLTPMISSEILFNVCHDSSCDVILENLVLDQLRIP